MNILSWVRKNEVTLLVAIAVLALCVRLYRVTNPLLDWHAFRQADTASVTREYLKNGIDPLRPTYLDISSLPSGTDNPKGYRMVEFPIIAISTAALLTAAPQLPLEQTSRVGSILFSVLGLVALYGLVRSISGRRVAMATAIAYAFLPYSIFYGRAVLPEPILLGTLLSCLYAYQRWLQYGKMRWYVVAFLLLSVSFLLKPYTIFFAPIFIALAYVKFSWRFLLNPWLWLLAVVSPVPMLAWRSWITQFPEGIPANTWLFNGNDIRFRPAWFRWLFYERLTRLLSGTFGMILIASNIFYFTKKETLIYGSWWLGMLAYLSVLATGNVQHDYYQVLLIPIVAITLGRGAIVLYTTLSARNTDYRHVVLFALGLIGIVAFGASFVLGWQKSAFFPEMIATETIWLGVVVSIVILVLVWRIAHGRVSVRLSSGLVVAIFCMAIVSSWQYVSGYFNVNHWQYVRAGQAVQAVADADALIIAPNMGDTQLLFQTDRKGWAIGGGIEEKIAQGADYYLSANFDDETKTMMSRFATVTQTDEFILIDLHAPLAATSAGEQLQ